MMPTDMENNQFAEDLGEEKSISPTFRQLQAGGYGCGGRSCGSRGRELRRGST